MPRWLLTLGLLLPTSGFAQVLSDNFEANSASNYTVVNSDVTNVNGSVEFAFDYVTAGFPLAPRSAPGAGKGLKMAPNNVSGAANALTAFHNTAVNLEAYTMTVDVFMAFQGTTATTIYAHPGVGGDGTTFNAIFTPISGSGSFMAFTGDGGSASDYRWYLATANGGPTTFPNTDGSHQGYGSNNSGTFFQGFLPSPPSTFAGVPGNIWVTVEIQVDNVNKTVKYFMINSANRRELIFDSSLSATLVDGKFTGDLKGLVSLGAHDSFNSLSPASVFVIYDNLTVEEGLVPVELTAFTGFANGNQALLQWTTASETNNSGFEIEQRSGQTWSSIGFVSGQGTTEQETSYQFTTGSLTPGLHAFRLRQIDYDGTTSFSPVVEVAIASETDVLTLTGANPFRGSTQVGVSVTQSQFVQVELYDITGRLVSQPFNGLVSSFQQVEISADGLAPGMYLVRATGERFSQTLPITVVR